MYKNQSDEQAKQLINSIDAFKAYLSAQERLNNSRGSMYWADYNGVQYLVKEVPGQRKTRIGIRSRETELVKEHFENDKQSAKDRFERRKTALERTYRLNRALAVGSAPNLMASIWNNLSRRGLEKNFLLIGTNALYVYESLAGVQFFNPITATDDIDILWDSRKDVVMLEIEVPGSATLRPTSFLEILRLSDSSFTLDERADCRAINSAGVMVDLVKPRRASYHDEVGPLQVFRQKDDLNPPEDIWPAAFFDMNWLLSLPFIEHPIVCTNGSMAMCRTIDPRAFVLHKAWLSQKADRSPLKVNRDLSQAKAVAAMIRNRLPQLDINEIPAFPRSLIENAKRLGVWESSASDEEDWIELP